MASRAYIKRIILTELADDSNDEIITEMINCTTRVVERALFEPQKRDTVVKVFGYVEEVVPHYTPSQFRQHFRIGPETFESLCQEVCRYLKPTRTVTGEKKVLATVWLLANQESYRSVADRFGFNKGQLHEIVVSVCHTLVSKSCSHVKWPEQTSYYTISEEWRKRAGFPGVIGAVDGTYIPIPGPCNESRDAYICRKGYPAMQLQVVCDHSMKFIDVHVGNVGSVHDARVWRNSDIKRFLEADGCLPNDFHVIGDSAYPNSNYLLVPFRDNGHLTAIQKKYNLCHSRTRVTVEHAIGLLKSKFRRLKYLAMSNYAEIPFVIYACCVLHNFILKSNDLDENEMILSDNNDDDNTVGIDLFNSRNDQSCSDTKRRNIANSL